MSQNDFSIANQGFPSFRTDLNSSLQALASNSSGDTEPSTTYAYQWWYDSTNDLLKMRNADNDAWITFATFDQATDTFTITTDNIDGLTATVAELNKLDGVTDDASSYFTASGAFSNRNLIINGAMQVAQRSTSETGLGNGTNSYKTVDRYSTYILGLGTWTQSQDTDAPDGFGHSLKMLCTTADASPAAGDRMLIQTKIEGQDIQSLGFGNTANTYTVSFYVKSNLTGTYILEQYGEDASATGNNISTAYTINAADTWERKTITLNVDSGAMTADNTSGLVISFWLGSGTDYTSGTLNTSWSNPASTDRAVGQVNLASATSNYWQITGVQLEVGDTATPFEHRSYGDELARCQRYYYKFPSASRIGLAHRYGANGSCVFSGLYPVAMRAIPTVLRTGTIEAYNNIFTATYPVSTANTIGSSADSFAIAFLGSGSGYGVGEATTINTDAGTMASDAEL